ncbi:CheR family methyltransferase [Variovorax sp. J22G73]|uniref:CheR family methyltransferase n=1 Tax=unclassified Variovorax TaxID=663243 RepID=UPI002575B65E|nr:MULTISPECIES: CheR family methyltransferase [unclassified Variovorax]MDM0010570.1 CheR family methyltransferase [Variovorax sp. J22R203]MDM0103101.1 CheR family methyltransferase [Variovorax sp. J22G73]
MQNISKVVDAPQGGDAHMPPPVVGIGGSAGGLQALMTVLEPLKSDFQAAIVAVLHLSPDHQSHAAEVLQRITKLRVSQVTERTLLKPGHVYVIAPGTNLITDDGHVQPAEKSNKRPSAVIDLFFRTLGEVHRERAVAVVLSGTGSDGALGIKHVKEFGGFAVAQQLEGCEHDDMPKAAIATGAVDLILSPADIGKRLAGLVTLPSSDRETASLRKEETTNAPSKEESDQDPYQDVLNALRVRTRHDFKNYKRATVRRRLERRMQVNQLSSLQDYRDFLKQNPEEFAPLLADLLISVTNFFRDPGAFEALQNEVLSKLMEQVEPGSELRVWVAACASGEESYSVAIALQEQADRMANPPSVQIFASDISNSALATARAGVFPPNISADVSESRLIGFFEKEKGDYFRVRPAIREKIIFAQHNVLSDPPFSKLDLICCRNLLIYLDRTAQAATLEMFAYALRPGGYLFLGSAESVEALSAAFETVDKEHRIFRLRPGLASIPRVRVPSQLSTGGASPPDRQDPAAPRDAFATYEQTLAVVHERALVTAAPPNVLVDAAYEIERASHGIGRFVAFNAGVPTRNLLSNVAPDIRVELRTALFRAAESGRPVQTVFLRDQLGTPQGGALMALSVHPIRGNEGEPMRWLVLFDEPVSMLKPRVGDETEAAPFVSAIERLENENKALKTLLQDTLDRSAVSNEELKASNEELQAINEELRSAKEELETSKEELQSVNEELTTVNFELRSKVDEAGRNNDDLRNLIEASDIATVFVDSAMSVKRFTPEASKLFALIPTDVGRPLMDVKSRLVYEEIVQDASAVFRHLRPVERSVTSIDGEHFLARILPYRTSTDKIGGAVLTFVNVTALRDAESRVRLSEERLRDAIAASSDFCVISTDMEGAITTWNEGAEQIFGYSKSEVLGRLVDLLYTEQDRVGEVPARERAEALKTGRSSDERFYRRSDGTAVFCSGVLTPLHSGEPIGFLKIARDTSASKRAEQTQSDELLKVRQVSASTKEALDLKDRFLAVMSHELKQPLNLISVNAELMVRLPELKTLPSALRIGRTIGRAVAAQEKIVNDLLDLSRIQTGKLRLNKEPHDLVEIVRVISQAMAPDAAAKNIRLYVTFPERAICDCDAVRIEQIVWNLLGNALKFTPDGGTISVSVETNATHAKLEVRDSGPGIAAESLGTVFELFRQAAAAENLGSQRAGLGIGLALVRELALAHGGSVEATSPGLGKGAAFQVLLPLDIDLAATTRQAEPTNGLTEGRRVLVVDDDADMLSVFAKLLELEGMAVTHTPSAKQALHLLSEGAFDLVFSDIDMPEMSGLEFIQKARELRLAKPFQSVAITGFGREVDVRSALEAGFDAHLSKPISLERIAAQLKLLAGAPT